MSEQPSFSRRELVLGASVLAVSATLGCSSNPQGPTLASNELATSEGFSNDWPTLKHYDQQHLSRIAMPIGGIGTGTIALGGRGDLRDWEIVNRPAKGYAPPNTFFALWAKSEGEPSVTRAIERPLDPTSFEGSSGSPP